MAAVEFQFKIIANHSRWWFWNTRRWILYVRHENYHMKAHIADCDWLGLATAIQTGKAFDLTSRIFYNGSSLICMTGDDGGSMSTMSIRLDDEKKFTIRYAIQLAQDEPNSPSLLTWV